MPIGNLLSSILSPFISGLDPQVPPQAQTTYVPPQQPMIDPQTAQMPAQAPMQAEQGYGVTPLAQSLLAGYFAAIGSPKQQGWGGAISRGGLTALDAYNQAKSRETEAAMAPIDMEYKRALASAARSNAETDKAKLKYLPEQLRLESIKTHAEIAAAKAKGWKYVVDPKTMQSMPIRVGEEPPPGFTEITTANTVLNKPEDETVKAMKRASGKAQFEAAQPLSTLNDEFYFDPDSGREFPKTMTRGEARQAGGIVLDSKKRDFMYSLEDAEALSQKMRDAAIGPNGILPTQDNLPLLGAVQNWADFKINRNFNPEKYAEFESANANFFDLLKTLIVKEKMTDSDRAEAYKMVPTASDTQESAAIKLDQIDKLIQQNRRSQLGHEFGRPKNEPKISSTGKTESPMKPQLPEIGGKYEVGGSSFTRVK